MRSILSNLSTFHIDFFSPESGMPSSILDSATEIRDKEITGSVQEPVKSPITTELDTKEKLFDPERAKEFGNFYQGYINGVLEGDIPHSVEGITNSEDMMLARGMMEAASSGFKIQATRFELADMDARTVLSQVFTSEEKQSLLDKTTEYSIKQHAPGVYEIDIDHDLFTELYSKGASAVAVKVPNGVSFVIVPRFKGEKNEATNKQRAAENLPHETHHIAWGFMESNGVLPNTEEDPEIVKAFRMYRDEIVARMVSEGALFGYSHLKTNPERMKQLREDNPTLVTEINEQVSSSNEIMGAIREQIGRSNLHIRDLILSAVQSSNFDELKQTFATVKQYIETNLEPETDSLDRSISG